MRATRLSGPLLGLAALLALPLLILTAPAAATTTGAFAERSAQPGPPVHAATLSCEQAEAKLQSAKKKLKRAKKKVRAAKKKARKAKKGGKRAKVKKAKRKLKRAKKKLKKAMKRRKRAKAALQDCQDDGPPVVPPPPGDNAQAVANAVLARAPQRPGDINLFTSEFSNGAQGLYPQGSAMAPASGAVLSESQVRGQLDAYLRDRFGSGPKVAQGLAIFDAQQSKDLISEPLLRAALAGLVGTVCEPATRYLLDSGNFIEVRFGPLPNAANVATASGPDGSRTVVFNNQYVSEDVLHLLPISCHEVFHDDQSNSDSEEVISHTLDTIAYLQVLNASPELAYTGTQLSRFNNTVALAFLNSRERGSPDSEIYAPTNAGIAPGSPFNVADIWTLYEGEGSSPAPPLLGQILQTLGLPAATQFSQTAAEAFENLNDGWLSDVERLRVAVLLKLISLNDIAAASGLGPQQAIDLLGLQPYLDAAG